MAHRFPQFEAVPRRLVCVTRARPVRRWPVPAAGPGPSAGPGPAGALAGLAERGSAPEPILVITGRGGAELIVDWPGFDAMRAWVASRGTTAVGGLTPPPMRRDCRAWEEDLVLARLVTSPRDVPDLTAGPAAGHLHHRRPLRDLPGRPRPLQDWQRLLHARPGRRRAHHPAGRRPPYALAGYGAAVGLFPHAYLARLAATEVTREKATSTTAILIQEDDHYRARAAAHPQHATAHETTVGSRPAEASAAPTWQQETARIARASPPDLQRPGPLASPVSPPGPRL